MITGIEAVNLFYNYIMSSVLLTDSKKPNGTLCKYERPENSIKEDMVINSLGLNRDPVQKGVLLFNIYVNNLDPNLVPSVGTGRNVPDTARILYLSKLFQSLFQDDGSEEKELWINQDTNFEITSDDVFADSNNQHYISFRINFLTIK